MICVVYREGECVWERKNYFFMLTSSFGMVEHSLGPWNTLANDSHHSARHSFKHPTSRLSNGLHTSNRCREVTNQGLCFFLI